MNRTARYEMYKEKVETAIVRGYSMKQIVDELKRERASIMPRCVMKQATLATDKNLYKKREAERLARECITAIDLVLTELQLEKGRV